LFAEFPPAYSEEAFKNGLIGFINLKKGSSARDFASKEARRGHLAYGVGRARVRGRKAVNWVSNIFNQINALNSLFRLTYARIRPTLKYILTDRSNALEWFRAYMKFSGHFGMPLREGAINPEC
jgi:hypothetical protein